MIIGLDMGGTHIDGVIIKDGKIINKVKSIINPDNLFDSIWTTLKILIKKIDKSEIERINLSTTISTNAIIENKTSPVGMIIQAGPGLNPDFLNCGEENIFISGYVNHRGELIQDLDKREIKDAKKQFKENNIQSCAIVTKFSIRNPEHEIQIKNFLERDYNTITMGHTISGQLNFPRRVYSSYLNSAVHDTFMNFSQNIKKSLKKEGVDAPLFILKADGGTMDIDTAEERPIETILSGPAASFMGINAMLQTEEDGILLDIGGTTTDIFFLADGVPLFEPSGIKINNYKTLIRSIYSTSIGLGGDSFIEVKNNQIKIGPERKGYPIAFGGNYPTPTDAMVVLELITEGDQDQAYKAMESLGKEINLSPEEISEEILNTMGDIIKNKIDQTLHKINTHPVYTIEELLHGKKVNPKLIHIIGGPAKILAPILENKFKLPTLYPRDYHIANAIGAALSKPTIEINMIVDTERQILSVPELEIYEKVNKNFELEDARQRSLNLINDAGSKIGNYEVNLEGEIIEENSFNMVKGLFTSGKNIRVKTQIKPGLIYPLRSDQNNES